MPDPLTGRLTADPASTPQPLSSCLPRSSRRRASMPNEAVSCSTDFRLRGALPGQRGVASANRWSSSNCMDCA